MRLFLLGLFIVLVLSQTCVSPKVPVILVRTYSTSSEQESVEIYEGNYLTGTLIVRENGYGHASSTTETTLCLNPTIHTLAAIDGARDGWTDGSTFQLRTRAGVIILTGTLDRYQKAEFKFSPTFTIENTVSWKYSNSAQSSSSWAAQSFGDSSWATHAPGSFPAISTITRYFRYTTTLPSSRSSFAIADIGVYSAEGIVVYINGNEVLRRNLPAGAVSSTTTASSIDSIAAWRRITIPATSSLFRVNGQESSRVTMAVEVHGRETSPATNTEAFSAFLIFVYGECNYRLTDGSVTASKPSDYGPEPASQLFDGDIQTKWYVNNLNTEGPASATFTFNNGRREWVNQYTITTGNYDTNRRPYEWQIDGSNDGASWTLLDHRSQYYWDGYRTTLTFPMRTNTQSYNMLRFTIIKAGASGTNNDFELGDVSFYACNYASENPSLSYGVTSISLIANMDNNYYYPSQNGFSNFSINPAVPTDGSITFDTLTGTIHVVPTAAITMTSYTISATHVNTNQNYQTTLTISASICSYPNIRFDIYQRVGNTDTTGETETVQLYNGGSPIFTGSLTPSDSSTSYIDKTYRFCQSPTTYTVTLTAGTTAGFSGVSYVSIDIYTYDDNYKIVASRSNLRGSLSRSYTFNAALIAPTTIKALGNSATVPANWNTVGFDDSTWTTSATNQFSSSTKFLFVRYAFTVPSNNAYLGFELMYTTYAAPIVYVDGNEISRHSVTAGALTDATTGYQTTAYAWRTVTGTLTTLPAGSHVIAVAHVKGTGQSFTDATSRAYLRMLADCDDNARTWDAGSSQSSYYWSGSAAAQLFDSNYNTRGSLRVDTSYPLPQWWAGNFQNWRFETFNKYCLVTNWDASHQDPASFTLYGSMGDWNTWVSLHTVTDAVFEERSTRYCYYMPNQNQAYNIYKLEVNAVADSTTDKVLLAELELYLVDFNKITVAPLSYGTANSVTGYVGATLTTIAPSTMYYYNFQLTGTLPLGVTFSSSSGAFSGTPTAASARTTYTVTATSIHGTESSTTVSIEIQQCALPNVLFTLMFYDMNDDNSSSSNQNGFTLANVSGTTIMQVTQFPNYMNTRYYGFCVPAGPYTLTLTDTHGDGWGSGKVDVIDDQNNVMMTTSCLAGESPKAVTINVGYLAKFGTTNWKYTSGSNIAANWNTLQFVDSAWSTGKTGEYVGLSGVTSYYRTSVSITSLTPYALYEVRMNIRDGLIAYLNGVEIYRVNLPTTTVTATTRASSQFPSATIVMTSDSVQFGGLREGNNVFAFELHAYSDAMENTFDAQITLQASGTNRVFEGTVTTNHPGLDNDQYHEGEANAFDNDRTTKYYAAGCGYNTWLQYNYPNNRKEYVSSISISRGNHARRMPDYYQLYGVEGTTETLISSSFNFTFGTYGTRDGTLTYDFVNKKAYSAYKIHIDSYSCTEGLEIGEIELNAKRIGSYCEAEGNWFAVLDGQYSSIECGTGLYGVKRRICSGGRFGDIDESSCIVTAPSNLTYTARAYIFHAGTYSATPSPYCNAVNVYYNITPALPSGLSIGRNTGIISGSASSTFAERTFTVMVCNLAGLNRVESCITTEVTLSAIPSEGLGGGAIAVIVIAVIIIIIFVAFVVFIVFNRRKNAKKGHKQMRSARTDAKKPSGGSSGDKKVRI